MKALVLELSSQTKEFSFELNSGAKSYHIFNALATTIVYTISLYHPLKSTGRMRQ